MTRVRLKGLKIYARNGRWYAYFRETGQKLDGGFKGSKAEFLARLATPAMLSAYSRSIDAQPIRGHGTLGSLIDFYKTKPKWRDLSPRTQADYEKALTFLEPTMDTPLVEIAPGDIAETRDRAVAAHYAKFANDCLSVLSAAFSTGREYGMVQTNPVTGIRRAKTSGSTKDANRRWTDKEWTAVIAIAPAHLVAVLGLARWAGLRGQDIAVIRWDALRDGALCVTARKNGVYGEIPIFPPLKEILEAETRETLTIAKSARRKPYPSENALRKAWHDFKNSKSYTTAVPTGADLTLHGLRVTYASWLRDLGFGKADIAAALLDKTEAMGGHYARGADKSRLWKRIAERGF